MQEVTESEWKNILTIQIEYPNFTARIILTHAPQETDKAEDRENFYEEMMTQVERGETSGDVVVVVGDFNARIESHDGMIKGTSSNGKLATQIITDHDLSVCNFDAKAEGKWTRLRNNKDGSVDASTIDYILISNKVAHTITEFSVDESKIYCPYREKLEKGEKKLVYSDHCPMMLKMEIDRGTLKNINGRRKEKVWKFDEEGYMLYEEETKNKKMALCSDGDSASDVYSKWEAEFVKTLRKCFKKKTVGGPRLTPDKQNRDVRKVLKDIAKQGKIQRKVADSYMVRLIELEVAQNASNRAERLKTTMSQLSNKEKFNPNGYWKMKAAAGKRPKREMNSVMREDGVEVKEKWDIIEEFKNEFEHRLRSRSPKQGWEEYVKTLNESVRNWLKSSCESSPPFTIAELRRVIKRLKRGKAPGMDGYPPELFIRAGEGMLEAMLDLFNAIKRMKETPEQWNSMKITTIYKQKGSKKQLKYYRGIFLAVVISKIFEGLIKDRIEDDLAKVHILQAGSRKNRGGPDNVFLLRGCIDHFKFTKRELFVTAYDYEQAFDSLWVEDCILALKNIGVSQEMLQLVYSLNRTAKVVVDTPHGCTSSFTTGPIVKQGTVLGSVMCSASTGEYCGTNAGVAMGTLLVSSLLYVDDKIDLSGNNTQSQLSHQNAVTFSNRKKLTLSGTKCFSMIINKKKQDPVQLVIDSEKGTKVVPASEIVYLGDVFNEKGNNDGLIKDRIRRGTKASISIISILQELDLGSHHFDVALLLYRALFLSTVLYNAQVWSNLRQKDLDVLSKMQSKFLKRIVGVAYSTCSSFTLLELGVLPIECEIHIKQLCYLYRILQLEESDPVYQMWLNMKSFHECGEKNWWADVVGLLCKYGITMSLDEMKAMSKEGFKKMVKETVSKKALVDLVRECSTKKKTAQLEYNHLKVQAYMQRMNLVKARTIFQCRAKTLDIKDHRQYKYADKVCRKCNDGEETLPHIVNCGHSLENALDSNVLNMDNGSDSWECVDKCLGRVLNFLDLVK